MASTAAPSTRWARIPRAERSGSVRRPTRRRSPWIDGPPPGSEQRRAALGGQRVRIHRDEVEAHLVAGAGAEADGAGAGVVVVAGGPQGVAGKDLAARG